MTDGVIAGTGNSRYLKTIETALAQYPTYEDFMQAMVAGTFPIDLNGVNASGWIQQGTPLTKANLLSDSVGSSLSLSGSSITPTNAFAKLKSLITTTSSNLSNLITIGYKSITVDATQGTATTTMSITLGYKPILVILYYPNAQSDELRGAITDSQNQLVRESQIRVMTPSDGNNGGSISSTGFSAIYRRQSMSKWTGTMHYVAFRNFSTSSGPAAGS